MNLAAAPKKEAARHGDSTVAEPYARQMARLLVVHHSPSRSMGVLVEALLDGARDPEIEGVEVVDRPALEATAEDVLGADGYVLATPANFGYMSGALKHFFDSTFLAIGGSLSDDGSPADGGGGTAGRPFGLLVHGRYDTTGGAAPAVGGRTVVRQGPADRQERRVEEVLQRPRHVAEVRRRRHHVPVRPQHVLRPGFESRPVHHLDPADLRIPGTRQQRLHQQAHRPRRRVVDDQQASHERDVSGLDGRSLRSLLDQRRALLG